MLRRSACRRRRPDRRPRPREGAPCGGVGAPAVRESSPPTRGCSPASYSDYGQAHDHYLKGSIFCGECGSRLILSNARSSQGVIYPYFLCAGRHSKRTTCERKSMFVPDIEAAVEDYYRRVQIPGHIITALRELVTSEFDRLHATARHERHAYTAERDGLRDERKKLLQAHYAGMIPLDLLGEE
ncbi:MAG: zinc ribbon domain-containing protein, partial [Acidimicrobiales bacterium]